MRAGRLRHRITLQRLSSTQNTVGEKIDNYTDVTTVWGEVKPFRGSEVFENYKEFGELTHKITIRYYQGLDRTWRIKFDGRIFRIVSVVNIEERDVYMEIVCKEILEGTNA